MHYSVLRAPQPLRAGPHEIALEFTALERGLGSARLLIDGDEAVGPTEVRTAPMLTSPMHEGLVIGRLWGSSPAWRDLDARSAFTGSIDEVEIVLGPALVLAPVKGRAEG